MMYVTIKMNKDKILANNGDFNKIMNAIDYAFDSKDYIKENLSDCEKKYTVRNEQDEVGVTFYSFGILAEYKWLKKYCTECFLYDNHSNKDVFDRCDCTVDFEDE